MSTESDIRLEETLVEMAYRWGDIEEEIGSDLARPTDIGEPDLGDALEAAFRVEARYEENEFGDAATIYELFYDVEDHEARDAARWVRECRSYLNGVIGRIAPVWDHRWTHRVRVTSRGVPSEGQVCGRPGEPPPKRHVDVTDVPAEKPDSTVPLTQRDGYWLTPIEVPFYDALRDTGLVFAVQPWIQGVERRYRLDFLIFYDGGMVAVGAFLSDAAASLGGGGCHAPHQTAGNAVLRGQFGGARRRYLSGSQRGGPASRAHPAWSSGAIGHHADDAARHGSVPAATDTGLAAARREPERAGRRHR